MPKDENSIELLWNLRKNSRQDLYSKGIFTLEQFLCLSLEEIATIKGIKSTARRYQAQAEAYVNKVPVRYGEMPAPLHQKGFMFDLETDVSGKAAFHSWCMGWSDTAGHTKIAIVNPREANQTYELDEKTEIIIAKSPEAVWWVFYEDVVQFDAPIFHWTGYDLSTMKQTAPQEVQDALVPRMHDLADSFIRSFQLPIRSYSIKEVARYFGFEWQAYDSWQQAFWDYQTWMRTGNKKYLAQACSYQRDDVLSMLIVWTWMIEQANG